MQPVVVQSGAYRGVEGRRGMEGKWNQTQAAPPRLTSPYLPVIAVIMLQMKMVNPHKKKKKNNWQKNRKVSENADWGPHPPTTTAAAAASSSIQSAEHVWVTRPPRPQSPARSPAEPWHIAHFNLPKYLARQWRVSQSVRAIDPPVAAFLSCSWTFNPSPQWWRREMKKRNAHWAF